MNFLGLGGPSAHIDFAFANVEKNGRKLVQTEGGLKEELYIFQGDEDVSGLVTITPKGKKVDHVGVKVELIGLIEFAEGGSQNEFSSLVQELDAPGVLDGPKSYNFNFANVEKPYESYLGLNVQLRYMLRVTVTKQYGTIVKEQDFWVENTSTDPGPCDPIKMEVGIDQCLHIEFQYNKSQYHLDDVVIGKVFFILVRIKIKHMELAIIKREVIESGSRRCNESETLTKFEIMDGAPVRGEKIPVRLFLSNYKVTPTFPNINNQFSVRYYLNLVLVDEEDRRYFKQQEITMWRKAPVVPTSPKAKDVVISEDEV